MRTRLHRVSLPTVSLPPSGCPPRNWASRGTAGAQSLGPAPRASAGCCALGGGRAPHVECVMSSAPYKNHGWGRPTGGWLSSACTARLAALPALPTPVSARGLLDGRRPPGAPRAARSGRRPPSTRPGCGLDRGPRVVGPVLPARRLHTLPPPPPATPPAAQIQIQILNVGGQPK